MFQSHPAFWTTATTMRATLKEIFSKYGPIAVALYLAIFTFVLGVSYLAISIGWNPQGVAGNAGVFAAAYIVTKITQPVRIAATVLLTPVVGRLWRRGDETAESEPASVIESG